MQIESVVLKVTGGREHKLSLASIDKLGSALKDALLADLLSAKEVEKVIQAPVQSSLLPLEGDFDFFNSSVQSKALSDPILDINPRTGVKLTKGSGQAFCQRAAVKELLRTGNKWLHRDDLAQLCKDSGVSLKRVSVSIYLGGLVVGGVLRKSTSNHRLFKLSEEFLNKYI